MIFHEKHFNILSSYVILLNFQRNVFTRLYETSETVAAESAKCSIIIGKSRDALLLTLVTTKTVYLYTLYKMKEQMKEFFFFVISHALISHSCYPNKIFRTATPAASISKAPNPSFSLII